jgi:hypothetical protein
MTEQRWIVAKQTEFSVTRRTILGLVGGIVGCSTVAFAQGAGRRGGTSAPLSVGATVVRTKPGEILVTLKKVGDRWKSHLFPGNISVEGADAPAALRAMADRIEQTFTTGGTK